MPRKENTVHTDTNYKSLKQYTNIKGKPGKVKWWKIFEKKGREWHLPDTSVDITGAERAQWK